MCREEYGCVEVMLIRREGSKRRKGRSEGRVHAFNIFILHAFTRYKYRNKTLYEITVIRVPVKVRKTQSLKLRPAAQRP